MPITVISGIYFIKNLVNNKVYVGSSINIKSRLKHHKKYLSENKHINIKLQRAWNKYGEKNFIFIIIEKVINLENLIPREQYWIDYIKSCKRDYNICPNAGNTLGIKHTEKTKRKISKKAKGRIISEETRMKISKSNKGKKGYWNGKKRSKSFSILMSKIHKGKIVSEEIKRKMSKASKGVSKSIEHNRKNSESHRGQVPWNLGISHSEKTKKKISQINTGKIRSEEVKRKLSLALSGKNNPMFGKHHSEESIKRMSEVKRKKWILRKKGRTL